MGKVIKMTTGTGKINIDEMKKAINKLKTREGSLTKNSFSPNIDIDIAESQVDNGGLAKKGTP